MREYEFSLTRIFPYKDKIEDEIVSENPFSRIFYAVSLFSRFSKFCNFFLFFSHFPYSIG